MNVCTCRTYFQSLWHQGLITCSGMKRENCCRIYFFFFAIIVWCSYRLCANFTSCFISLKSWLRSLLCPFNTDVANWLAEPRESANIPLLLVFPSPRASSRWKGPPKANGWPVGCVLCEGPRPRHNTTHSSAGHHSWAGMWPASDWALCVWNTSGRRRTWMEGCQLQRSTHRAHMSFWISCKHAGYFVFNTGKQQNNMTKQGHLQSFLNHLYLFWQWIIDIDTIDKIKNMCVLCVIKSTEIHSAYQEK